MLMPRNRHNTEYKSEKTMEALKKMASPTTQVIRGSADHAIEVPSSEIVPGDLVLLSQGDRIPAGASSPRTDSLECLALT
jgi:Ca2+-transporting ATPase